jgi:hypothetical protein
MMEDMFSTTSSHVARVLSFGWSEPETAYIKDGAKADCKISAVPVSRPKYPDKTLNLVICRGLGKDPLLLLASLDSNDQILCVTITKAYLMRWRIEAYYKFKKQGFGFEKLAIIMGKLKK